MASKRETPQLSLAPDLPDVVSRDFNLFYKPDVAPVDESVKVFTQALDSFVSGAGTSMVIQGEVKQKKEQEAKAIEAYNNNKKGFNDAVKQGLIPKEANPYFIQKYQQLELGEKARQFKDKLIQEYGKRGLKEDASAGAFDNFYKDELKKFFRDNQLGLFQPSDLAKSFFGQTDKFRNELYSQHSNSQLAKVSENYKKNFKNDIQGLFEDDGTPDTFKNIGDNITNYIKDKTANGLGNSTAREYFLEALNEYVANTDDFDFAQKLLDRVPNFVKLGTDSLGNIKGLKDEFNKIQDALIDREIEAEDRAIKRGQIKYTKEKRFIKSRLDDEEFDLEEFKKGEEYKSLSREGKAFVETYYSKSSTAFASNDNLDVRNRVDTLITEGKFEEAEQYLLDVGSNQLTKNTWNELNQRITIYDATQTNGLINDRVFKTFKSDIDNKIKAINKNGTVLDPRIANDFDAFARQWLNENASKYPKNSLELKNAFKKAITEEYNEVSKQFLLNRKETKKETYNPEKIGKQTSAPQVTDTGDVNIVYMPKGLTARQQMDFKQANKNATVLEIGQKPKSTLAKSRDEFNKRARKLNNQRNNTEVVDDNNQNRT